MHPLAIIVHLNILKNRSFCLLSTGKDFLVTTFFLECCPKALYHCIIIAIPFFTHTPLNSVLLEQQLIAFARIFASSIGMMNETSSWLPLLYLSISYSHLNVRIAISRISTAHIASTINDEMGNVLPFVILACNSWVSAAAGST